MSNDTRSRIIKGLLMVVVLVSFGGSGIALVQENEAGQATQAPDIEFEWEAPTNGTPVHHYVVQVMVNQRDTLFFDDVPTESLSFAARYGNQYRVRVAGVDMDDIQGPWSIWSLPYNPEIPAPEF